jgi:LacI family transcriptional regulator, gluconate utilization system Gnt-I transcriptional repressor
MGKIACTAATEMKSRPDPEFSTMPKPTRPPPRHPTGPDAEPAAARPVRGRPAAPAGGSVTLADVARLAGISPITVSRALHRPDLVSPATRETVLAAVERLGYVPNLLAGSLASRRSRLVAAIVPSIETLMFSSAVEALTARLRDDGYQVILGISEYNEEREEEILQAILGRRPDALFLTGIAHTPLALRLIHAAGIPVVEAWDLTDNPIDIVIGFSHEQVGRAAARFLLGKGYRRFALVWAQERRAGQRRRGFLDELAAHGIDDVAQSIVKPPTSLQSGRASLTELLERGERPQAVFCASDPPAQGVVAEALTRGLRIPNDIAVMGFGDLDFAAHTYPSLSTIRIEPARIGRLAAEAILARLAGRTDIERVVDVGFTVCERQSA